MIYFNTKLSEWVSTSPDVKVCQDHGTAQPCPYHECWCGRISTHFHPPIPF